jgi:cold shock CspA family protein
VTDGTAGRSGTDGVVTSFDEGRGRGVVTAVDGATFEFHATCLADGTRRIAVGTKVQFEVVPALRGRWEASRLTRV